MYVTCNLFFLVFLSPECSSCQRIKSDLNSSILSELLRMELFPVHIVPCYQATTLYTYVVFFFRSETTTCSCHLSRLDWKFTTGREVFFWYMNRLIKTFSSMPFPLGKGIELKVRRWIYSVNPLHAYNLHTTCLEFFYKKIYIFQVLWLWIVHKKF